MLCGETWGSILVAVGESGLILGRGGNSVSFPLVAGNTGFLLSCNGDLGILLK